MNEMHGHENVNELHEGESKMKIMKHMEWKLRMRYVRDVCYCMEWQISGAWS